MRVLTPPIKMQGKKSKLVKWILSFIPEDFAKTKLYIEPFVGSGIVGFNLNPKEAVFSDINPHIIRFYKDLQENVITPEEIKKFLISEGEKLRKRGEDYYYEVRERFNKKPNSLDFIFLNRASFNGVIRFNMKGEFNVPFCKKENRFSKSYIKKIYNEVKWVYLRIKNNNWVFLNKDFREVIKYANYESFVYLDPPYIERYSDYFNKWSERDENDLFTILSSAKFYFILSSWEKNSFRENPYIIKYRRIGFKIYTKEHFYIVRGRKENSIYEAVITNIDKKTEDRNMEDKNGTLMDLLINKNK